MLSIIICSISSEALNKLKQNISDTIGIEYEIISINNNEKHWPIAKAYNYAAKQAKYPFLFFAHEDIKFHSINWGNIITKKLMEPDCGIIGFTGSKVKLQSYSGWAQEFQWIHSFFFQNYKTKSLTRLEVDYCFLELPFREVLTLDGFAMFVRKNVWERHKFDEENLTGFHCYDIDFSLQIAKDYKNYVSSSIYVLIEHFSTGNMDTRWYNETIRMHNKKWKHILPMFTSDINIEKKELDFFEEKYSYNFLYNLLRTESQYKKDVLIDFWKRPFSWKHFTHCLTCSLKYIKSSKKERKA